jgi:hypothetical protein
MAIFRQQSRTHEAHLVMVGNEMDTHGIGQAQVDTEEGSRPALPIISHRLSGFTLFAGGSRLRQIFLPKTLILRDKERPTPKPRMSARLQRKFSP